MSRSQNSRPRWRTRHVCDYCAPGAKQRLDDQRQARRAEHALEHSGDDYDPECFWCGESPPDDLPCSQCGAYDGWCEDWCVSYRDEPEPLRVQLIDIARVR